VKIDAGSLPQRANIHYLGMRGYDDLPAYMGEWDVAMMPFARNAATRFISPTKTPEYLSAGVPVVSTSILDVVRTYGTSGLVAIADEPAGFAAAIDAAVHKRSDPDRLRAVDAALAQSTWESVWEGMAALERARRTTGRVAAPVPASIPAGSRARAQ
jgi:UDP-galactopyranose mutase